MVEDRLGDARSALARGDVLLAYDAAQSVVDVDPDDLEARFVVALALARAGSREHALQAAEELRARLESSTAVSDQLLEDSHALVARLTKDRALAATDAARVRLAAQAADLYEEVANRYGGYFSCVNAATLRVLAGQPDRARQLAEQTRLLLAAYPNLEGDDAYWYLATQGEAALVLGDTTTARAVLARAAVAGGKNVAARALTRRQLRFLCEAKGIDEEILDVLAPSTVLHFCGHRIDLAGASRRFPAELETHVAEEVAHFLDHRRIGFAYGSLASGADIIVAEAVLDRDIELNVVLSFDVDEFERTSVADSGPEWSRRYRECLARASTVRHASDSGYLGDDELFGYAARIAMGHAMNRAAFLGVDAEQLAVWNGEPGEPFAGTGHDVDTWRRGGRPTHVIRVGPDPPRATRSGGSDRNGTRDIRAVLFGDFHGFSRLRDEQFPAFVHDVLGAVADALRPFEPSTVYRNSWGDAIVVVLTDVVAGAACALAIQEAIAELDCVSLDLPEDLGLRIGAHVGPVMTITDPVRGQTASWGRELTRAARIEPRTPEGDVYVTDAFAALLALEVNSGFATEYVGRVTTAKQFETIPMYRLRRA